MFKDKRNAFILILFSIKVLRLNGHEPLTDFDLVKGIWNGTRYISLTKYFQPEIEEISEWPNGPYALPMPIDGCPESSIKGWERGYIDLTWQHSHVVVSWNQSARDHYTDTFEQFVDVTNVQLPEIQSLLLGPYGRYRVKLNFCFKKKRNATLDVGVWPDGNYSIYGVETGCPSGFSSDIINKTIGKVSHITYDGHLPEFKLQRSGHKSDNLEMRICEPSMRSSPKPVRNLMMYKFPFILLQSRVSQTGNDSFQCPHVSAMDVTEQSLYLYPTDAPSNITALFRFCYFRPQNWKQEPSDLRYYGKTPNGTFAVRVDVTNGELTLNSGGFVKTRKITPIDTQQGIMELLASDLSQSTKIQWQLLDFGRTVSIYGILIPERAWPTNGELACYHSNAKWDFLESRSQVCSYTVMYVQIHRMDGVILIMKRLVECRYMAFVDSKENTFSTILSTFIKFTALATNFTSESANKSARCTIDLGMIDYGIDDFQISASTSLHNFPVHFARPFLSSWCACVNDTSPWLLIDLQRAMRVEGITIWNREYVYEAVNNGSFNKHILNIGVKSFSVSFGDSKDNMKLFNNQVFLLDAMYPVENTQSFMFHLPFTAHFVKIHVLEPLATSLSCLRFELHGCRKTSTKILECQTSMVIKRVPALNNPSKRAERVYTDLTVKECNDLCVNNTDCSIVNYFNNGSCLHYGPNHDKTWMLHSSETNDRISSAKVCSSDYIETPYVAFTDKWFIIWNENAEVIAYTSLVRAASVLTSIGFPLNYGAGENYKWIISYDETEFIKLVFTSVNMNKYIHDDEAATFCQDKLLFNEEASRKIESIVILDTFAFTVDSSYNGHIFSIESGLSYLTLTFRTCPQSNAVIYKGNGFRVLISKLETAACLYPETLAKSSEERKEYCDKPSMSLSSMTYLNIPFAKRNETWVIHRKKGSLRIDITEFDIKCSPEIRFVIADRFAGERTFCNLNRPPNVIHTASSSITVYFSSQTGSDAFFRLVYTNIYETFETVKDLITSKGGNIQVIKQSIVFEALQVEDVYTKQLTLLDGIIIFREPENIPRLLYKVCSEKFGKCYSIFSYFGTWERAGAECWIRRQRLVSIRNADELKLIKYLMRNFKFLVESDLKIFDSSFRHNDTDMYYTYIGLHRKGKNTFLWENRTPLTFSAWSSGQPSTGDCTRMGFYKANEDYAWETSSCLSNLAFYFVCETSISNTTLESYEDILPKVYRGKLDKTNDGSKCTENSYCRLFSYIAHYKYDANTLFSCKVHHELKKYDELKSCNFIDTAGDRCLYTHHSYAGASSLTASGKSCERWGLFMAQDGQFPDKDLNISSNYCRDPTFKGFPWCFISYPEKLWEICEVEYGNDVLGNKEGTFLSSVEYFECKDGKLVDSFAHCNGVIDCVDASDETNCSDKVHPLLQRVRFESDIEEVDRGLFYQCKSQEVISYLALCDGVIDCQDASDEKNCTNDSGICSKDQFTCGDGSCIHISLFCNFISECTDASDEACDYPSCSPDEYMCENLQCIPNTVRCNAIIDCFDGTDENNCGQDLLSSSQNYGRPNALESPNTNNYDTDAEVLISTELCTSGTFHCDYVKCLPRRLQCDTYTDCEDEIDERSCDMDDIASCREWWDKGYRKSGKYKSYYNQQQNTEVYCEFSFMSQRKELLTVFLNMDTKQRKGDTINTILYTTLLDEGPFDELIDFFIQTNGTANCTQEIVQSCIPTVQATSERDFNMYPYCHCLLVTMVLGWEAQISAVRRCNDSEPMDAAEYDNMLLFEYKYNAVFRAIELKNESINADFIHLKIGNITCKESYMKSSVKVACNEGKLVYDASVRCIYDVDRTDIITGCRSGSHLQNCDEDCPNGTVKCPGSYCVPLKFVCDGIEQCPDAEDEFGCGCDDFEKEVVIIHEEFGDKGPDIMKLAKQLSTPNSIIRSLQYISTQLSNGIPFSHKVLHIRDSELTPSENLDRNYKCDYTLLANQFLNSVRFTKQKGQTILFIQSSPESELVAKLMFDNITKTPNFTLYRVMESTTSTSRANEFPFVIDITVKNWKIMSSLASRYLPKLCTEAFSTSMPGSYKCSSSKMSITRDQVCDGRADCIYGDDELLCNFVCPDRCVCNGFAMSCKMNGLNSSYISLFSKQTRSLTISNFGEMEVFVKGNMLVFPFLYALNLSSCKVSEIQANAFGNLRNLRMLDISNNMITQLFSTVFNGLQQLQTLILDGNKQLSTLEPYTFQHLHSITSLRIAGTDIRSIVSNTFAGLSLKHLNLQNNIFETVEEFGLGNLIVEHIDFESNVIATFDKGMFKGVSSLKSLRSPAYKYCCVRPSYLPEDDCFPRKDEFSSCEDLMRISILQTMLWLIGLCALFGNILSVIYRLIFDRDRLKLGYGIFVTNLAVADFLMGVYLIIIAVADAVFRNRYIFMDDYWRNSSWCTFAGVLSTMSSEASVMFLCLITLDRLIVIKYPFGQVRIDSKKAVKLSLIVWTICFIIAIFPLMYSAYFQNLFYNKSGVCIALPLTRDRPPGWLYSVLLFVGLNFVTFILIAVGQWSIYMDIRKSAKSLRKGQSARKKDLLVARNLLLVVATDFLCWFPIGCTGLMAISGRVISGDVYAWAAVFILPVNSALNPVLYTLTAILGKKSFTPRIDEQSNQRVLVALGKRFLAHTNMVIRRFNVLDESSDDSYDMLGEALKTSETLPVNTLLKMSHQLVETLLMLHKNALVFNMMDDQSLYVKVSGNKITGDVQLRHEPGICRKPSDTKNDMYNFGLLLGALLKKGQQRNNVVH